MEYKIPRGTYDILPADSSKWQFLRSRFREIADAYGYLEISTPVFEASGLFERSSGESSDVVQKEMYRFTDRKGREFALRPEGTAPVVRSFVENRLDITSSRVRMYYIGPMFRYDRPQAGRYRQFYQYGIEFFGSNHPFYDAEVISLLWYYLTGLGLKNIRLEINSVGCPNCSADYDAALREFFAPHVDDLCPDCLKRLQMKPRRLLDCKVPTCKSIASGAPSQLDYLDDDCRIHFDAVKTYLEHLNVPFTVNPKIVRGLDYYSNTAFEVIFEGIGAQNSLAGGGRYNSLVEQVGGKPVPAIGFAGGFERLLLALENEGIALPSIPDPDVFAVAAGDAAQELCVSIIAALRLKGVRADFDPDKKSFKAQMKAAGSSNCTFAMIVGEDEIQGGFVTLKDMNTGEQTRADASNVEHLAEVLLSKRH